MILSKLLKNIDNYNVFGKINKNIQNISQNSKKIAKNVLFFCINGTKTKGCIYINEAIKNGAVAIVTDKKINFDNEKENLLIKNKLKNITQIVVNNVRRAMAIMSANFYNNPQKKLKIVGITGTNGKTSCSYLICSILKFLGKKVGLIGTNGVFINDKKFDAHMTTPDSIELFKFFDKMVKAKVEFCVMEVSAHAIYFDKVYGINFAVKALTNVKTDHLDFFKTQQNYQSVKQSFFKKDDLCVLNKNDKIGQKISKKCKKSLNFGKKNSNFLILSTKCQLGKTNFKVKFEDKIYNITSSLTGKFNIDNISLAICVVKCLGFKIEDIINKIVAIKNIDGRFDVVFENKNINIIIDYAHTLDSLKNLLSTIKNVSKNKNIIVFGCPGERDTKKRFLMGKLAAQFCDCVIFTSDNPASENPRRIMFEMQEGLKSSKKNIDYYLIEDRKKAIKKAITTAIKQKNVNVLIVGKGIENYQIVGEKFITYSDYDTVKCVLKKLF